MNFVLASYASICSSASKGVSKDGKDVSYPQLIDMQPTRYITIFKKVTLEVERKPTAEVNKSHIQLNIRKFIIPAVRDLCQQRGSY